MRSPRHTDADARLEEIRRSAASCTACPLYKRALSRAARRRAFLTGGG
jgi:hypothetical protein